MMGAAIMSAVPASNRYLPSRFMVLPGKGTSNCVVVHGRTPSLFKDTFPGMEDCATNNSELKNVTRAIMKQQHRISLIDFWVNAVITTKTQKILLLYLH